MAGALFKKLNRNSGENVCTELASAKKKKQKGAKKKREEQKAKKEAKIYGPLAGK